jgi:hypothetical protein
VIRDCSAFSLEKKVMSSDCLTAGGGHSKSFKQGRAFAARLCVSTSWRQKAIIVTKKNKSYTAQQILVEMRSADQSRGLQTEIPEKLKAKIIEAQWDGATFAGIANKFGFHLETIRDFFAALRFSRSHRGGRLEGQQQSEDSA